MNAYAAAYRQTEAGRQAERDRQRRDRAKVNARRKVVTALGNGTLERGPCERLGPDCSGRIEAHHDDYDKPLDVRWLCSHHHAEVDREETP